jgi:hypothetical protein
MSAEISNMHQEGSQEGLLCVFMIAAGKYKVNYQHHEGSQAVSYVCHDVAGKSACLLST